MKIIKYIFLLLLLFSVAFVVFVATQPTDYTIKRTKEIKASKDIIYNFVSDSTAFVDWNPWDKNETSLKTIHAIANDSVSQNILINNEEHQSFLNFKTTSNGTLVSWEMKGSLDFNLKMMSVLRGGVDTVLGKELEQGLTNIETYLVKELTKYTIQTEDFVTLPAKNYLKQVDTCALADFEKRTKFLLQNMLNFVTENKIKTTGAPFLIYENKKTANKQTIFALCIPVEDEILTTEGSEITGGHFDAFFAAKTLLTGDYSHRDEAWRKTTSFIRNKKFIEDKTIASIEIFKVCLPNERKPSKWVTEIYIPVKQKITQPKVETPETVEVIAAPEEN